MGSSTAAVMGFFMLWWGWLGFNAGATFGISGNKWIYASKYIYTVFKSRCLCDIIVYIYALIVRYYSILFIPKIETSFFFNL